MCGDDWQVGDLALCLRDHRWRTSDGSVDPRAAGISQPRAGEILRVSRTYFAEGPDGNPHLLLSFECRPQWVGWYHGIFRKIRPDHSADEIETGLIEKIKRATKQGEPA